MDRKSFLKKALLACTGWCGCAGAIGQRGAGVRPPSDTSNWIHDLERRMISGAETPGWRKAEKAEGWIKDLIGHLDDTLDEETRIRLMQACGRSCYIRAFGVADVQKPSSQQIESNVRLLQARGLKVERKEGAVSFIYSWGRSHQNPQGLILHDGYCMCPIVESGPQGLSPTFCFCSTGYVKESFERMIGPVDVELLASLKRGDDDCVFRITVSGV